MSDSIVDDAFENMALRDESEPYREEYPDRSFEMVDYSISLSLAEKNQCYKEILDWESAPVVEISRFYNPPLEPVDPQYLTNDELEDSLISLIQKLHEKKIVLLNTARLSSRYLYTLILRGILPQREKNLSLRHGPMLFDCSYIYNYDDGPLWEMTNQEQIAGI